MNTNHATQMIDTRSEDLARMPANAGAPTRNPSSPCKAVKPLQKLRFCMGLLLTGCGIGTVLMVAVGTLQQAGVRGQASLPLVAISVIGGVLMLGGGFGLMATASAGFDDDEFDRLMQSGGADSADVSPGSGAS